eukprot:COSAG05_NODE_23444_length_258_cov_0.635220_1_plen_81_part_01
MNMLGYIRSIAHTSESALGKVHLKSRCRPVQHHRVLGSWGGATLSIMYDFPSCMSDGPPWMGAVKVCAYTCCGASGNRVDN